MLISEAKVEIKRTIEMYLQKDVWAISCNQVVVSPPKQKFSAKKQCVTKNQKF